jgi:hypothetical protein
LGWRFVDGKDTGYFRFIAWLLGHRNRLSRIADLYAKRTAGGGNTEVLVAEATDEVKGFLWLFLLRETERVRLDLRLDRGADMRRRAKETVRRHESLDGLARPLEVVVLDEKLDPPKTIREVGEHRPSQKFVPQRLPEALDLAQRLRMLRSALGVPDTTPLQQLLELRLAAPRHVLPALICQHLLGLAVLGDATFECVDDQARLVVMRHPPGHEVARVVVHEADDVHDLMTAQLELEDVALPELVRLGALEAPHRMLACCRRVLLVDQTRLVQDAAHGALRDAESF